MYSIVEYRSYSVSQSGSGGPVASAGHGYKNRRTSSVGPETSITLHLHPCKFRFGTKPRPSSCCWTSLQGASSSTCPLFVTYRRLAPAVSFRQSLKLRLCMLIPRIYLHIYKQWYFVLINIVFRYVIISIFRFFHFLSVLPFRTRPTSCHARTHARMHKHTDTDEKIKERHVGNCELRTVQ